MTPDGDVPAVNPFPGSLVYSYGHTATRKASPGPTTAPCLPRSSGRTPWNELNIITPGANYGWPAVEGIADDEQFTNPVQQWEPSAASPSGIAHVNGTLFIANLRERPCEPCPSQTRPPRPTTTAANSAESAMSP